MRSSIRASFAPLFLLFIFFVVSGVSDAAHSESPSSPVPGNGVYFSEDLSPRKIKIFVTNDVHGRIFENASQGQIGYALLEGYMDLAREAGFEVFLFDAGDAVSGNAITQFDCGKTVAEFMGGAGYRVIMPGNNEFNFNEPQGDPLYYSNVLLQTMREHSREGITATCLNLGYDGGDVPGITRGPVVLIDEPDFRLAVVGVLTPYTRKGHNLKSVEGYDFGLVGTPDEPDNEATKRNIINMLTEAVSDFTRPGDIVVVLSHIGDDDSDDYRHGELRGSDLALVPNVDFVVDSHSHNLLPAVSTDGAFHGIANRYLTDIAELTVIVSDAGVSKAMEIKGYADLAGSPRRESTLTLLREISDRLGLDERLFELSPPALSDEGVDRESVALARLLCLGMTGLTGSDLTIINSGNIRASLMPGWVTIGDIYDVIPYQNGIVTFTMTGAEIRRIFDTMPPRRSNAFPQHFGMTVYAWEDGEYRLGVAGILDRSGSPLDPDADYTVTLNDFIAYGGDGYEFDTTRPLRNYGDMATSLSLYLRNRGPEAVLSVRENHSLFLYPTRDEAEAAYSLAAGSVSVPAER